MPARRSLRSGAIGDDRSDAALVAAAQAGDRAALDALLRRHHDRLYALCRRVTGNDSDAADACQEALIAIVRSLGRFDGRSAFSTWAYRVATNASLDELRRRRRRPDPGLPDDDVTGARETAAGGDAFAGVDTRVSVDAALADLPADYRVAVVLRDLCGLAYAEIAEVLDVPIGTVRSRIARGRAALMPILCPDSPDVGGNPRGSGRRPTEQS
ncbi:MAG TPA: sigma-70 family RNA polymerase sigma factor [Acidimicrobiales bacterium]|nr:sigma-70 family RNA polymerase sigma factor [Acidimicrobiales bacterium]